MGTRRTGLTRYFAGKPPGRDEDVSSSSSDESGKTAAPPVLRSKSTESAPRRIIGKPVILDPGVVPEHEKHVEKPTKPAVNYAYPPSRKDGLHSADALEQKFVGVPTSPRSEESAESEDSSRQDETSESEVECSYVAPLLKPVFVPRSARLSEIEKEAQVERSNADREREEARRNQRAEDTRNVVADIVAKEDLMIVNGGRFEESLAGLPDDRDYSEEDDVQYALWKVREMRRILREREEDADLLALQKPS